MGFKGGDRLKAAIKKLAAKAEQDALVKVGFFEGSTEPDGESTPMVAAMHEFGGTIPERVVPEHVTTIYRRLSKNGDLLDEGRFVKASESNFASDHVVPEHIIPEITVPSRPFFRRMISLGEKHWGDDIAKHLKHYDLDAKLTLGAMGLQMQEELQESIGANVYQPLAQSTINKKGFDQTLIDSGTMQNAVDYEVDAE